MQVLPQTDEEPAAVCKTFLHFNPHMLITALNIHHCNPHIHHCSVQNNFLHCNPVRYNRYTPTTSRTNLPHWLCHQIAGQTCFYAAETRRPQLTPLADAPENLTSATYLSAPPTSCPQLTLRANAPETLTSANLSLRRSNTSPTIDASSQRLGRSDAKARSESHATSAWSHTDTPWWPLPPALLLPLLPPLLLLLPTSSPPPLLEEPGDASGYSYTIAAA